MIKIGVIGAGYWGAKHIRVFDELPEAQLSMVADLSQENLHRINQKYPEVTTTQDYRELLNSEVDGVVIATPVRSHFRLAKEALEYGKHVMVEKPLTASVEEAEALVELAEQRGLTLMVGHTFEYNPAVEKLRELVTSGELGRIYYIDSARLNLGLFQSDVSVLWDLAPHDISIILYLLGGEPLVVSARGGSNVRRGIHDVVYLELRLPGDVLAHVHVSWLDPCKVRRTTVVGSNKMAVYNDVAEEKIRLYDKGITIQQESDSYVDFELTYRQGNTTLIRTPNLEPLRLEDEHFVASMANGTRPRSDGYSGLRVVRILEAAQRSLFNEGHRAWVVPGERTREGIWVSSAQVVAEDDQEVLVTEG